MTQKHVLLFGAHISTSGGLEQAIIRGESIGCTAIQLFTKNNRQWNAKPISQEEATLFKQTADASTIRSIVAHATYLINLGSSDELIAGKSVAAVVNELERCAQLNIPYLVLHPGLNAQLTPQECAQRIAANINSVFEQFSGPTVLLLENMAGQGSSVCHTFEQLALIYAHITQKDKVAFCFDTCHAFAAGYDFRTPDLYTDMWRHFDTILGLDTLKAIHINDSKKALGSRVDRHEDIGKGQLGLEPFALLFNDPRFFDIPKILETPKDSLADDARNMAAIRELINNSTKKILGISLDMNKVIE
jgi:deoxyribonuclease-4